MDCKKLFVAGIVATIAVFLYQFVIHTFVLGGFYETVREFMRPEGEIEMGVWMAWAFLADLVVCLGLGYMFIKGYEGKGMSEAVRFGALAGLVFGFYFWLFHWLLFPGPFLNSVIQIVVVMAEFIVATMMFAIVYKPKAKEA